VDFRLQFRDGASGRGLIDQGLLHVFLLLGSLVVVVLGRNEELRKVAPQYLLPASAEFLFAETTLQAFAAAFERLENGFGRGGETALQCGECEADGAFARSFEGVGLAHLRLHVVCDGVVERCLKLGESVVYGVGLALWKERGVVELNQLLLHHAAHEVGGVDLVGGILVSVAPVEAVRVEQGEEELEVLGFAVVRRGRHQEQVTGVCAESFCQTIAAGFLQFVSEEVSRELVRLIKDNEVPSGFEELGLD